MVTLGAQQALYILAHLLVDVRLAAGMAETFADHGDPHAGNAASQRRGVLVHAHVVLAGIEPVGGLGQGPLDVEGPADGGHRARELQQAASPATSSRYPSCSSALGSSSAIRRTRQARMVDRFKRQDRLEALRRCRIELARLLDGLLALGLRAAEGKQVVVVKGEPIRAELGQLVHGLDSGEGSSRGVPEGVSSGPANRPEAKGELVGG